MIYIRTVYDKSMMQIEWALERAIERCRRDNRENRGWNEPVNMDKCGMNPEEVYDIHHIFILYNIR